jgi:hypothetical protein
MDKEAFRNRSRRVQAVTGTIVLGGVLPAIAYGTGTQSWGPQGVYIGLGLAFAAYTAHAFFLSRFEYARPRRNAFGLTLILGLTYPAWLNLVGALVGVLTGDDRLASAIFVPNFNAIEHTATPVLTGTIIAACLWATTRSVRVALLTVLLSIVCGLIVLPTSGASCILWNLGVAAAEYTWACARGTTRERSSKDLVQGAVAA